ncbi:hypothetical protein [Pinirhizobacter soli]|uniref:hypothetical protein n=1 Tax=Pinirhizobacter soli TaxID=2786953 RepID=UPI00202A0A2F|nr:hypothetical protein [Pinirhizobacter soli]
MRRVDLVFEDALTSFLAEEGASLLTNVSERNTCGRLAIYLQRHLEADGFIGYYADVEYNRKQQGLVKTIVNNNLEIVQITPDLIAHTRGERPPPHDNLIAVEAKKSARPDHEKDADRARLQAMTRTPFNGVWPWDGSHPEHVCGYAVGVYVEIDIDRHELRLEFYKKGRLRKQKVKKF